MTLISIVVPAHNAADFLGATLDGVLAQTHDDWECIVVDDSSEDETLAVAEQYALKDERIRVIHVEHGGVSKARNAGFMASSDSAVYCTFMDADDVWTKRALASLLHSAQSDPSAIGAHGVGEFIDDSGQLFDPGAFSAQGLNRVGLIGNRLEAIAAATPTDFAVLLANGSVFPPGLLLVARSVYLEVGPFDELLVCGEDWEMLTRVTRQGHLAFLPRVILFYRRHEENRSAKSDAPELVHQAYCQIFHSPLNSGEQRDVVRRVWKARQRGYISGYWDELRSSGLRSPRMFVRCAVRSAVAAGRSARGYPKPVVHRGRLEWESDIGSEALPVTRDRQSA